MSILEYIYILLINLFSIIFVVKAYKKHQVNIFTFFSLTFYIFYIFTPTIYLFTRITTSYEVVFLIILNSFSNIEVISGVLFASIILVLMNYLYNLLYRINNKIYLVDINTGIEANKKRLKKIYILTDFIFIIGFVCITLLIAETGSIQSYLSLGSLTRGIDKDPTMIIRSSYLMLVTLSTVILATPYLYLYLFLEKKKKIILIKFIIALFFAILFLLYNQGRAPLILFILPFIFFNKRVQSLGLPYLTILMILSMGLLRYLDSIFNYITYGIWKVDDSESILKSFVTEFSYPFSNFMLKENFIEISGYRVFYDYVIWPFTLIPNSFLELIGIDKSKITSVSLINTDNYVVLSNMQSNGGIPVDILTFHYYQLGYLGLFIGLIITLFLILYLDKIFKFYKFDLMIKIIVLRISFSVISMINNADFSAIIRNRLDIIILIILLCLLYKSDLKSRRKYEGINDHRLVSTK